MKEGRRDGQRRVITGIDEVVVGAEDNVRVLGHRLGRKVRAAPALSAKLHQVLNVPQLIVRPWAQLLTGFEDRHILEILAVVFLEEFLAVLILGRAL